MTSRSVSRRPGLSVTTAGTEVATSPWFDWLYAVSPGHGRLTSQAAAGTGALQRSGPTEGQPLCDDAGQVADLNETTLRLERGERAAKWPGCSRVGAASGFLHRSRHGGTHHQRPPCSEQDRGIAPSTCRHPRPSGGSTPPRRGLTDAIKHSQSYGGPPRGESTATRGFDLDRPRERYPT
jgi:hypothetical protein